MDCSCLWNVAVGIEIEKVRAVDVLLNIFVSSFSLFLSVILLKHV